MNHLCRVMEFYNTIITRKNCFIAKIEICLISYLKVCSVTFSNEASERDFNSSIAAKGIELSKISDHLLGYFSFVEQISRLSASFQIIKTFAENCKILPLFHILFFCFVWFLTTKNFQLFQ